MEKRITPEMQANLARCYSYLLSLQGSAELSVENHREDLSSETTSRDPLSYIEPGSVPTNVVGILDVEDAKQ
jgi:hypothetical protein